MRKMLLPWIGISLLIASILSVAADRSWIEVDPVIPALSRWAFIALLCVWGVMRKSLTAWIIISMVIGVEIGVDLPGVGHHMNIVSKVFIQLIKTVIGPLLFATLVLGIAGHSNLKQVGRMGWKSLLYFEVITTVALFIGLAAINLSQAGVGVKKSDVPAKVIASGEDIHFEINKKDGTYKLLHMTVGEKGDTTWKRVDPAKAAAKGGAEEFILHIFPENIAKSIFEGSVLQIVVFSILFGIGLSLVHGKPRETMLNFTVWRRSCLNSPL
jgi:proton glutamate symport protein